MDDVVNLRKIKHQQYLQHCQSLEIRSFKFKVHVLYHFFFNQHRKETTKSTKLISFQACINLSIQDVNGLAFESHEKTSTAKHGHLKKKANKNKTHRIKSLFLKISVATARSRDERTKRERKEKVGIHAELKLPDFMVI